MRIGRFWCENPSQLEKFLRERKISLPPEFLDKCAVCKVSAIKLHLCAACGEAAYCGRSCQKYDWAKHKLTCGRYFTAGYSPFPDGREARKERIDLNSFFPHLAGLFEQGVWHPDRPLHPALRHKIINSPNPSTPPVPVPGGRAKLVMLGKPLKEPFVCNSTWWPEAGCQRNREMLFLRILREGWTLPNYIAICVAILSEVYTSTSKVSAQDGEEISYPDSRIRFCIAGSLVTDFGIVKGRTINAAVHKLAYRNCINGICSLGQNPDEHFWIYFKTARGEEYGLDCGLYTFNFYAVVHQSFPYSMVDDGLPKDFPAYWETPKYAKEFSPLHEPLQHFSLLRDARLHRVVTAKSLDLEEQKGLLSEVMSSIAGRKCAPAEKALVVKLSSLYRFQLFTTFVCKAWMDWPAEPVPAVEQDFNTDEPEMWTKKEQKAYKKRLAKQCKRNNITETELLKRVDEFINKLGGDLRKAQELKRAKRFREASEKTKGDIQAQNV